MALNKKAAFKKDEIGLANFAKALSHPARIAILKAVAEKETCICGEIVEVLPLAQSTVSQHIKELIEAGLLKGTVEGVKSCYCINTETLNKFSDSFRNFISELTKNKIDGNCC